MQKNKNRLIWRQKWEKTPEFVELVLLYTEWRKTGFSLRVEETEYAVISGK